MIQLKGVGKTFPDGTVAVHELDLDVPRGALVTLVGPSGCGKSTTLKMVNRLIEPTSGTITLDGADVTHVDPVDLRRGIGYVIQQVGLFPHQTIRTNVGTVPDLLGWPKDRVHARCDELLDMVGLDPAQYGDRYPAQLSGGQRQRVGVARALAADPPVLLMDEPFGAVDPVVRGRLQEEFSALQRELGKTVMFVTHDIDEAVRMGDRVAVFAQGGRLAQYDTPARALGSPADEFVTEFVGADRGLRRLAVTDIDAGDIEHPLELRPDLPLTEAAAALAREAATWAAVVDGRRMVGWIAAADCSGDGLVGERVRKPPECVSADATLKDALATMLRHDEGWVPVIDGDSYLGVLTPHLLHEELRQSMSADRAEQAAAR